MVVLRAVTKLGDYLRDYQFASEGAEDAAHLAERVDRLVQFAQLCPRTFDERALFRDQNAAVRDPASF